MTQPPVLVTGSTGLIGRARVDRLADIYDVVGLSPQAPPDAPGDFIELDVTSDESVRAALAAVRERHGDRIASVTHLAAHYDFSGEPSPLYGEVTVEGTRRCSKDCRSSRSSSSGSAARCWCMLPPNGDEVEESDPLSPEWDYPRSKVATEELLRAERGDMPIVLAWGQDLVGESFIKPWMIEFADDQ